MQDLTTSNIDRQNILNNQLVLSNMQNYLGLSGMLFEGEYRFTRQQVVEFYLIDNATIDRYLSQNELELKHNGYINLKGKQLKDFKAQFGHILTEGAKAPQLGVFNFRAFLNLGMLLVESDRARALRSAILNIVLDVLNQKCGGSTKYINQRDEDYLVAITREPVYRKQFTNALNTYLEMGAYKYSLYTDAIYKAIFDGKAAEYKQLLKLEDKDNPKDTMYAEVLTLISSFEIGIAEAMKVEFERLGRKLQPQELDLIIDKFSKMSLWLPLLHDARTKMASRDYSFRKVIHSRLKPYIKSLPSSDYERFLGDKSKDLSERIDETIEVFKRLKDR